VFGFTSSDELEVTKRNPGFLDQRMALAWVRENVHAFGGDCEKITIQGQSAGGYSVKNLWALPPTPLPFRATIMESQALLAPPGSGWDKLMDLVNCTDAPSQITCAQAVDAQTMATLATKNLLFFPPTVDNVTHIDHVERAIFNKTPARVPLLIGTNGNEVGAYVALLQSLNVSATTFTSLLPGSPQVFNALLEAQVKQTGDPTAALTHVLNQYLFTCGNRALASLAALNGYPTWRYLYNGTFAAFDLVPGGESHGATHSSELPIAFGTYPTGNTTEHDRLAALSEYVQERWTAFVKDPAGGLDWPGYFSGPAEDVLLIGNGGAVNGTVVGSGVVDYDCALYEQWIVGAGTV
jgi:carboxylesterase type B